MQIRYFTSLSRWLQRWFSIGISIVVCFSGVWCGTTFPALASDRITAKGNLGNDILYYITVDRFFDGNISNNVPSFAFENSDYSAESNAEQWAYIQANQTVLPYLYDPTHRYVGLYWGGDLSGIIQKLDYLKDLGITKLVLSPIQDNTNGMVYYPGGENYIHTQLQPENEKIDPFYAGLSTAFQGTWTKDWFELEEHFKDYSPDRFSTFRHLLKAAGERDIGIILELSLNSTSPTRNSLEYGEFNLDQSNSWLVDNGGIYHHDKPIAAYWQSQTNRINPQNWFHAPLSINYSHPTADQLERGAVGGIPDLNQDNSEVRDYLLDAIAFWLSLEEEGHSIAGFYLDTIENINIKFWQELENKVHELKPNTILIGEYSGGGYTKKAAVDWYCNTHNYSITNYNLSMAARRFFARDRNWDGRTYVLRENTLGHNGKYYNQSLGSQIFHRILNPSQSLEVPRKSLDSISDLEAKSWVNFIENHDQPRLFSSYPTASIDSYQSLIRFIFMSPGVPMLMYGTETGLAVPYHVNHQGLFGIGGNPFNQPMMIWPDSEGWDAGIFTTTQEMAHLRQNYPALRYGLTQYLQPNHSHQDSDIFMLRSMENCSLNAGNCEKILYAYSTFGGDFQLSLTDLGVSQYQQVGSSHTFSNADHLSIHLAPETSQVFILK